MKETYTLPKLPYKYNALVPVISPELLTIHHTKHHAGYVKGANELLENLEKARNKNSDLDFKSISKALSFNVGGHILHSLFWKNLKTPEKNNKPTKKIASLIKKDFKNFERFKKEFSAIAGSVEGSGWAALVLDEQAKKLMITQIEKHNCVTLPFKILLVLDVWEHAFYLDYKNEKNKFIESFWEIVNWEEVNRRI